MTALTIGLGLPHRPPVDRGREFVRAAASSGVDTLWAIDHFASLVPEAAWHESFTPLAAAGGSPNAIFEFQATMGYFAGLAPTLNLGVGVTEAIRRHPVLLAQAAVTLSHFSEGTIRLGLGAGERENIEPYGLSFRGQVSRLEEALMIITQCLAGEEPVTFHGEYFDLDQAPFGLRPPKGRRPEVWVAAHGPRSLGLAGRFADGWLPTVLGDPSSYGDRIREVRAAAVEAGRSPADVKAGLQVFVVAGDSPDDVAAGLDSPPARLLGVLQPAEEWERLGYAHPLGAGFRGHADWRPHQVDRAKVDQFVADVPREVVAAALLHGTPDALAERIAAYQSAGVEHLLLQPVPGMVQPPPSSPTSLLSIAEAVTM